MSVKPRINYDGTKEAPAFPQQTKAMNKTLRQDLDNIFNANSVIDALWWMRMEPLKLDMLPGYLEIVDRECETMEKISAVLPEQLRDELMSAAFNAIADRETLLTKAFYLRGIADGMEIVKVTANIKRKK